MPTIMMSLEVIGWQCSVPVITLISWIRTVDHHWIRDCYSFSVQTMTIIQYHCRNNCLMHVDSIVCTSCYIELVGIRPQQLLNCYDVLIVTILLKNMCIHVTNQYLSNVWWWLCLLSNKKKLNSLLLFYFHCYIVY